MKNAKKPHKNAPVIALLTDFGTKDHYVATMKGVILSINPLAQIVDISHLVSPQQIYQAGYLLWSAYKFFPDGTVFLSVVDPGVGTHRRMLAVSLDRHIFLAPDNGLLDLVFYDGKPGKVVEIDLEKAKRFFLPEVSSTFQGRDVFAPLAAHITTGVKLSQLGNPVTINNVTNPFVRTRTDITKPVILHIDRFGNIISNIAAESLDQAMQQFSLVTAGKAMVSTWVRSYAEAPDKTPSLMLGSKGLIEISVKNESAAALLNADLTTPLKIYWK